MGIDVQIGRKCFADPEIRPRASPGTIAPDPAGDDDAVARADIVGGELIGAEIRVGVVDVQNQPGVGIASGIVREYVRAGGVGRVEEVAPVDSVIFPAATGTGDAVVGIGGLRAWSKDPVLPERTSLEGLAAYLREGRRNGKEEEEREGGEDAVEFFAVSIN